MDKEELMLFMLDVINHSIFLLERDGELIPTLLIQCMLRFDVIQMPNMRLVEIQEVVGQILKVVNTWNLQGVVFCSQVTNVGNKGELNWGYNDLYNYFLVAGMSQGCSLCCIIPYTRDSTFEGIVLLYDYYAVEDTLRFALFGGLWGDSQKPAFN